MVLSSSLTSSGSVAVAVALPLSADTHSVRLIFRDEVTVGGVSSMLGSLGMEAVALRGSAADWIAGTRPLTISHATHTNHIMCA